MKIRPLQKSFSAGEISPRMYSHPELGIYQRGVKFLENFVTTAQGSARKRRGSQYISEISSTLDYGRIFTFRVNGSKSFVIVVTEDEITIHNKAGALVITNLLGNYDFSAGGSLWNATTTKASAVPLFIEPHVTFANGQCTIGSGSGSQFIFNPLEPDDDETIAVDSSARLTQQITGATPANEHTLELATTSIQNLSGTLLDYLKIGTTEGDNDIAFTVDPMNSAKAVFTPGVANFWITYELTSDDSTIDVVEGTPGNPGNAAQVTFDLMNLVDTVGGGDAVVTFTSPYSADEVRELQVEKAPGLHTMYFATRASFVTKQLLYNPSTEVWTWQDVTFTSPPATWAADGYPGCITFYQGRMFLAGTVAKPVTIWGSKAGEDDYEDFSPGTGLDAEALELPLARDGVIQWIQAGKTFHVGADTCENLVTGEEIRSRLTPANPQAPQQTSYGSYRIHAKWFSNTISFVSADQRRIYTSKYSQDTDAYESTDITFQAEHITDGLITETAYGQNPRGVVWASMANGNLVGTTYQMEADDLGWYRYDTHLGDVKSITMTDLFGRSILWTLVYRNNKLYLEREGSTFMDSHVIREYGAPTTTIDGLDHLENMYVQVLNSGAYEGTFLVVSGAVTVPNAGISFIVGLPIFASMRTLPVENLSQPTDSLTGKKGRWNKLFVRILASMVPLINGRRPPDRTASAPMDATQPPRSEDIQVTTRGRDLKGEILIEQDLPFDTEIISIFGEYSHEGF